MISITNLLTSLVLAVSVGAIAILSVQNATLISVKFLTFYSIQLPIGVVLGLSAAAGAIGGAIAPALLQMSNSRPGEGQYKDTGEYDDEDF